MKITIIGTGYVGLTTGTCFAETGNEVMCVDIDEKKIENLKKGIIPIYEPGLEELVQRNNSEGRLRFTTDAKEGIDFGEIIFSAVGTPPDKDHRADLQFVRTVARDFGRFCESDKIFVNKSTVPVGTGEVCEEIIREEFSRRGVGFSFSVVSNPEFLREGAAIKDTLNPSRVVVGTEDEEARKKMKKLYAPFTRANAPIFFVKRKSAEIIKYASNSFLATKISFINEIANFAEKTGGDISEITRGMGADNRIGTRFLHAGIGYGGSCFPKDVAALIESGKDFGSEFEILRAAEKVNQSQKKKLFHLLQECIPDLEDKTIAVLGLSFKPRTDDMRDAPSIKIIKKLQAEGVKVRSFDPVAMKNAAEIFAKTNLYFAKNAYDAAKNADAVLLLTEWDEFRNMNLEKMKSEMKGNLFLDGRNIFDSEEMRLAGFEYYGIGR